MSDDEPAGVENEDDGISEIPPDLLEDRERGLSNADREFLVSDGEDLKNERVRINTRSRVRKRIRESIVDFWLIASYLSDEDRDLIFREDQEQMSNWELQIGLKSAIQFFYAGLNHSDLAEFETILTSGIHDAERDAHGASVLVDVDFDVEVDEQFRLEEAYEKFKRGRPLDPMDVGVLLITGRVNEEAEIERLARHARSNGFLESPITPLLGEQLAEIHGEDDPVRGFRYTLAHLDDDEATSTSPIEALYSRSTYQYLEEERRLAAQDVDVLTDIDELADDDLVEEMGSDDSDSDDASEQEDGGSTAESDGSR